MSDIQVGLEQLDPLGWLLDRPDGDSYRSLLERPEVVVPLIGAGISKSVGYPLGSELAVVLKGIGSKAGLADDDLTGDDPRFIASILVERRVLPRRELLERVAEIYAAAPTGVSAAIDALLSVRSARVLTFNYDRSLELRASELGIECDSLVLSRDGRQIRDLFTAGAARDKLAVIHLHGIATEPHTLVLDNQGYSDVRESSFAGAIFTLLFLNHRVLFMGTQLDEAHILSELLGQYSSGTRHVLVGSAHGIEKLTRAERGALAPDHYGLLIGEYENRDYDHRELVALIERLAARPEGPASPADAPRAEPRGLPLAEARPEDYVPIVMAEKRDPDDDDVRASFLVALGLRAPVTFEQLATAGTRTLIEGAPGSGKSTLLTDIGWSLADAIVPIKLRANELDLLGDPRLLLAKWLEGGQAFRENEDADSARLTTETFHFLIDGLDETAVAEQPRVVQRIIEVARVNPAHSFTLASRPVPALEAFGRPEWVRVAIAPGRGWSSAYLQQRGITWEDLFAACPVLADLRSLLELPFFLTRTTELYKAGELADVADLLALVRLFVDSAVATVDETLPAEAVRTWLRRFALAMVLAGRSEVSLRELAASLPPAFEQYGSATEIAERFVSANLLRAAEHGNYSFVHRLIGEALAAEALTEIEPETSGVLDVAAPVVSDVIRGLRSDWLVPITLVAINNARWRAALAARDPLAAARTVPSHASAEERRVAGQRIWRQYREWRIWLNDRDRASIVDDQAVLVRLIDAGDLEDLRSELLDGLDAQDRETIGNALRVLAGLGDTSIEPRLKRILETTEDDVLARLAAMAARDLGLDRLFYIIAHRAINAYESTEVQTTTYAAIDLARDEDLIAFARRAARARGEAIRILSHAIRQRVAPRDELAVLRIWAAGHGDPLSSDQERLDELLEVVPLENPTVAEDALFIACAGHADSDKLRSLAERQPEAAARAAAEAVRTDVVYPFQIAWIIDLLSLDQLTAANAPEQLLEHKQRTEEWRRAREEMDES